MDEVSDGKLGAQLALELVSDKWTVLILNALRNEKKRYGELQREVEGISQRMLTHTLRTLEQNGLIVRQVYAVVPPKTEYSLTPLGRTLLEPLRDLCLWAEHHYDEILQCRQQSRAEGPTEEAKNSS